MSRKLTIWSTGNVVILGLLLALACAAVYWPGIGGAFLMDDYPNIISNPAIHATSATWESMKAAALAYHMGGRPLATITFALNHAIGGLDPWGYKVVGLTIHAVNALLVFFLLLRLTSIKRAGDGWSRAAVFAVALVWAIHPLQVSTVLYVVQRMETLSLTFVLLALLAYQRGRTRQIEGQRGWHWLAGSALLAVVGLLSKESAVLFPAYALALELTLLRFEARDPRTTTTLKWAYAIATFCAVAVFAFVIVPHYAAPGGYAFRDFTPLERVLTQARVLPMHLGQILLPLPGSMSFYYDDLAVSRGLLAPATTLAGLLVLASLGGLAWYLRNRLPLVSLGLLWFFAGHLLTSNVFPLELVFEHRNYFALLGVLLALGDVLNRATRAVATPIAWVGMTALVLGLASLTLIRSATWGNPLTLAMDMVARNTASARASSDLGEQYMLLSDMNPRSPFYGMAMAEFERGSRLPSASILPDQGLILMAASGGQPVKDEWWTRLIHKLRARPIAPQDNAGVMGLLNHRYKGLALDDRRLGEALAVTFERARMPASAYASYGDYALRYLGDEALAERMFVRAVEHDPTDADYAARIFAALVSDGRIRQADAVFTRASALGLMQDRRGSSSAAGSDASGKQP